MSPASTDSHGVRERWAAAPVAQHYEDERWASPRKRARDPRHIRALIERHGPPPARVLDVPCGTGRLRSALAWPDARYVGLDVSAAMLLRAESLEARLQADVLALPFGDGSFEAVVSCRLLHHLRDATTLRAAVTELVRVSSDLVVVTFWDARSLPAWNRRLRPKPGRGRTEHARGTLRAAFEEAGAALVEFRASFPLLARQTYAVARKKRHG